MWSGSSQMARDEINITFNRKCDKKHYSLSMGSVFHGHSTYYSPYITMLISES